MYEGVRSSRVVQDMYKSCKTEEFKVEMGLYQGSTLSPFLFVIVMVRLTDEVRQKSSWTMMFANDIVIWSKSRWRKIWRGGCMPWKGEE